MDQQKVGEFIKKIRKEHHMTQAEFASKYGVTYQAVSNWEHGKNLPDIALLKQISSDFNVSIDELLNCKKNNPKHINYYVVISLILILITMIVLFILNLNNHNNFEFKTLSSNCSNFKISGSISYNKEKTSIYINNINYCDTSNEKEYIKIECILYETYNNIEKQISNANYQSNTSIKLEEYLKNVEFTIDNYDRICKMYSNDNLYLRINATDINNKTETYKVPLLLNEICNK